ncbi:DUF309 domain-containing protein [Neobacillus sp. OS1-32]|uniref:DUF309 domain-containing protein n=1 Tax=Neobacillus sp. OS1-32 TaxID=3070682 RepID=UPI0027E0A32D|nr:DUF309 domain-containing protein [Neobacillus sp. OS1-32]WML30813.1 DUF309 domain-containing protein [Neobacillus sp. OS1-32]
MYPTAYIDYLIHFHGDRDYFECHEILEDYWKQSDPGNKDSIWVGLILMAVSAYHHRRENFAGAKRTLEKAIKIFETQADSLVKLGIDSGELINVLNERLLAIEANHLYTSFSLPIIDSALMEECLKICQQRGLEWGKASDVTNDDLIHRHKLRDRTSVIEERNRMLLAKKGNL